MTHSLFRPTCCHHGAWSLRRSQLKPESICEAQLKSYELALRLAQDAPAPVRFLNLGGGFPGSYRDPVPAIERYGQAITEGLAQWFPEGLDEVMVEPGRYLVADAGVVRSEVVLVSTRTVDNFERGVYLDAGTFHGLAETMGEAIRYRIRTPHDGGPAGPVALAGPTCDSVDVLYEKSGYELPLALAEAVNDGRRGPRSHPRAVPDRRAR